MLRFSLVLIVSVSFLYSNGFKEMEQREIEKMQGCYDVTFDFAEFGIKTTDKYEKAKEWIEIIDKKDGFVSLQHLLVTKFGIIKHWRQDWKYDSAFTYEYVNTNQWKRRKNLEKGAWTQRVFQVDDSPRYECTAKWTHVKKSRMKRERHFWKCEGLAALPRREKTVKRLSPTGIERKNKSQYNLLLRRNVIENLEFGWVHRQLNDKIYKSPKEIQTTVGTEIGYNTYKKIEQDLCNPAKDWWEKHGDFWSKVRKEWDEVYKKRELITLIRRTKDSKQNWVRELPDQKMPFLFEVMFSLDKEMSPKSKFDFKIPKEMGGYKKEKKGKSNLEFILEKIGKNENSIQQALQIYLKE